MHEVHVEERQRDEDARRLRERAASGVVRDTRECAARARDPHSGR